MVTGSHNPPEYNGLKIVVGGETLAEEAIQNLRQRIESGQLRQMLAEDEAPTMQHARVIDDYIQEVAGQIRISRGLKLVVDCGNGAAGMVAPKLLRTLGCEVVELFCEVDGRFPHHHPDPSQPENLKALIAAVTSEGADLGIAFDGDGDRLGVVDDRGNIVWPDRQLMYYAVDVLREHPGATVIYDVKCTANLERVIRNRGGEPLMWRTGHSLIKAKMRETGAVLAGEMSGHFFFRDRWYGFDDAIYAAARLAELLAKQSVSSSTAFGRLPDGVNTPELRVDLPEGQQLAFMERLAEKVSAEGQDRFPQATITTIDGVRVDLEDRWGLVRASNTTPCLVLRFEGIDRAALKRIQGEFRELLADVDPSLALPF